MRTEKPDKNTVESPTVDCEALSAWCESRIDGFKGPVSLEKFAVGQSNPTYLLRARSGRYVLRRKPPGALLQSAHGLALGPQNPTLSQIGQLENTMVWPQPNGLG